MTFETAYLGYPVFVHDRDFYVQSPDRTDGFQSRSMGAIRRWVRRHRRATRLVAA